jgi:hypothetical protein
MFGAITPAQPRTVEGHVHDEAGQPIARAMVRLDCVVVSGSTLLRDAALAHRPLPRTRAGADGCFVLDLEPEHDLLGDPHGALVLVVEAPGFQRWRERLPSPLLCWRGSEVRLPREQDSDVATVRIDASVAGAHLRLRRISETPWMFTGPIAPGEIDEVEVTAGSEVKVSVPLLPVPLAVNAGQRFAPLGWTVQLVAGGKQSEERAVIGGDVVTFDAAALRLDVPKPAPAPPARRALASGQRTITVHARLADGTPLPGATVCALATDDNHAPLRALVGDGGAFPRTGTDGACEFALHEDNVRVHVLHRDYIFGDVDCQPHQHTFVATGHGRHHFDLRTLDAQGAAVPFAAFGHRHVLREHLDGSGAVAFAHFASDSAGRALVCERVRDDVTVMRSELSEFVGRGLKLDPAARNDLVVGRAPLVVVRMPEASGSLLFVVPPGGGRRTRSGQTAIPAHTQALLFCWPASLPAWTHAVSGAPPVHVARDDFDATQPVVHVDRRKPARRVPLRLAGDVPAALAELQAPPRLGGEVRAWFTGDHLERTGSDLFLSSRDGHAFAVFLAHPDLLPAAVQVAKAPGPPRESEEPVVATLLRGTPGTLHFALGRALQPGERLLLVAHGKSLGTCLGSAEIRDARLASLPAGKSIAVRAPFALPKGEHKLALVLDMLTRAERLVDVGDTAFTTDFGAVGR